MSHYMTCPLCPFKATPENSREVGIVVAMLEHRTREHVRYQAVDLRGYQVCWYYHTAESVGVCPICGEEAAA